MADVEIDVLLESEQPLTSASNQFDTPRLELMLRTAKKSVDNERRENR